MIELISKTFGRKKHDWMCPYCGRTKKTRVFRYIMQKVAEL